MSSNDLDNKIKQLSELLSDPSSQAGLKNLLASLYGQNSSQTPQQSYESMDAQSPDGGEALPVMSEQHSSGYNPGYQNPVQGINLDNSLEMLNKAQGLLYQLNNSSDSRVQLLNAISPFLGNKRKQQCGTCINLLKLTGIAKLFNTPGGRSLF